MNKQEFINFMGPIARKVGIEMGMGNAQIFTCICQACCESGYGKSEKMTKANAFFGIKATKAWANKGGLCYSSKTSECYDGRNYEKITASFRAYETTEESVRDYYNLISAARYKKCLDADNVLDCITEIKNGGYATSPTYINTIVSIYNSNKTEIERYGKEEFKPLYDLDLIAFEVIDGKWGNGSERARRLHLCGYDYSKVQKRVNEILRMRG